MQTDRYAAHRLQGVPSVCGTRRRGGAPENAAGKPDSNPNCYELASWLAVLVTDTDDCAVGSRASNRCPQAQLVSPPPAVTTIHPPRTHVYALVAESTSPSLRSITTARHPAWRTAPSANDIPMLPPMRCQRSMLLPNRV